MIGTVQALDGNSLVLNTPVGPLEATVGDDTSILSISETEGTLEDLTSGLRVTITGERNEEGLLEATAVRVVPEGLQIPQRGQFAGQLDPGVLVGLAALSPEERRALALQASLMASGARASGSVTLESPGEGGEAPAGPPSGALTIPGRSRDLLLHRPLPRWRSRCQFTYRRPRIRCRWSIGVDHTPRSCARLHHRRHRHHHLQ